MKHSWLASCNFFFSFPFPIPLSFSLSTRVCKLCNLSALPQASFDIFTKEKQSKKQTNRKYPSVNYCRTCVGVSLWVSVCVPVSCNAPTSKDAKETKRMCEGCSRNLESCSCRLSVNWCLSNVQLSVSEPSLVVFFVLALSIQRPMRQIPQQRKTDLNDSLFWRSCVPVLSVRRKQSLVASATGQLFGFFTIAKGGRRVSFSWYRK